MRSEYLIDALRRTSKEYEGDVCLALRSIKARIERHEANDPDPEGENWIRAIVRDELHKILNQTPK